MASVFTTPTMVTFAWLYNPIVFVRVGWWLLRAGVCWPYWLLQCRPKPADKYIPEEVKVLPKERLRAMIRASDATSKLKVVQKPRVASAPATAEPEQPELPALPPGWRRAYGNSGMVYYWHVNKRVPQWHPPPGSTLLTASVVRSAKQKMGAAGKKAALMKLLQEKAAAAAEARAAAEVAARMAADAAAAVEAAAAAAAAEAERIHRQEAARAKLASSMKSVGKSTSIASKLELNAVEEKERRTEEARLAAEAAAAREAALKSAKAKVGAAVSSSSAVSVLQAKASAMAAERAEAEAQEAAAAEAAAEAAAARKVTLASVKAKVGAAVSGSSAVSRLQGKASSAYWLAAAEAAEAASAPAVAAAAAKAAAAAEAAAAALRAAIAAEAAAAAAIAAAEKEATLEATLEAASEAASEAEAADEVALAASSLTAALFSSLSHSPPPSPPSPNSATSNALVARALGGGGRHARVHPADEETMSEPSSPIKSARTDERARDEGTRRLGTRATHFMATSGSQGKNGSPSSHSAAQQQRSSENKGVLQASLTYSWQRRNWRNVRRILFGWIANVFLFFGMLLVFFLYGCELFEPQQYGDDNSTVPGNPDELLIAWSLSAVQRLLLHEPMLILAVNGLPMLLGSALCANEEETRRRCGKAVVNVFEAIFAVLAGGIKQASG